MPRTKPKETPLHFDNKAWGIRTVQLTKKKLPVGYVGYCNPCSWSTKVLIGTTSDMAGEKRAQVYLDNHLKSRSHIHRKR